MLISSLDGRAELRLLEPRHAFDLALLVRVNRERLYWMPEDFGERDALDRIRSGIDRLSRGEGLYAGIFADEQLVGNVALFHVDLRSRSGELGYWVDVRAEGRGLVGRSCAAMIDYGFTHLELRRMEIKCAARNTKSAEVAKRLGFELEGRLREAEPVGDQWDDLLLFGLLRRDWRTTTAP